MAKPARFQVDPKLASLLGEGYRSSEEALRELIDNAWDADASNVTVSLPGVLDGTPIVIEDDGAGMTEDEVRHEYLRIASDRTTRKGDRTPGKHRKVKGRKGIGKFAGLMAASEMLLETWVRGKKTAVTITKADLLKARDATSDLEAVDLPFGVERCGADDHGTRVTLTSLNQRFDVPSAERLRSVLVTEYGRENDFRVVVNGVAIAMDDVPGRAFDETTEIPGIGPVRIRFAIAEDKKAVRGAGLVIRINGKVVGRPSALGLEEDELLPRKLLKQVYGEIEADGLAEHVTGDGGAIVENSRAYQAVQQFAAGRVREALNDTFKNEIDLAKARFQKELKNRLAALPEHRRQHAEEVIQKILTRLYGEAQERIEGVVSVALDAVERDDYWAILKEIGDATRGDVARLASVLDELGLVDVAMVAHQAKRRLAFLDQFDALIANDSTVEADVHRAIEHNLWILGSGYRLISSNKSLAKLVEDWLKEKFSGPRAKKRPDLFLAIIERDTFLLIEFKRPSLAIARDHEKQASEYPDDLQPRLPGKRIDLLVVGGARAPVATQYETTALTVESYIALVSKAREELTWLVEQLAG